MKITKIEAQKKDKHRYNIFLDGSFAFGLYEDSVLKYGLRTEDELDEKKIKEMREFDEFGYGKKAAYSFLAYKPRSKKELVKKLRQKKVSDSIIDDIIELLEKQKYLDDKTFAKSYLEDKLNSKPIGRRLAKLKLFEKGVDKELIETTIDENYSEDKEFELAAKLMEKFEKKVKHKDTADKRNKCYRYLISKGFDYETAGRVLKIN